jgi:hypothetical protein
VEYEDEELGDVLALQAIAVLGRRRRFGLCAGAASYRVIALSSEYKTALLTVASGLPWVFGVGC